MGKMRNEIVMSEIILVEMKGEVKMGIKGTVKR